MDDVRALRICYEILSRMDERAQVSSMEWLWSRLRSDREAAAREVKAVSGRDRIAFRRAIGDVALNLISLTRVAGGAAGRRSMKIRGAINADVMIRVKPVQ